jgi:hypothetical protein
MALPERCWKCDRAMWAGRQEVTPPLNLESGQWHRRTWCRYCDAAQDEIRGGGMVTITSRLEPIPVGGVNPFLEEVTYGI